GFVDARLRRLDRALIAAELALHRARHVQPAELLDGVVAHAFAEDGLPRIGEAPEARGHVRPHRRALGAGRSVFGAAAHLALHALVPLLQRDIADSRRRHDMPPSLGAATLECTGPCSPSPSARATASAAWMVLRGASWSICSRQL